MGMHDTRLIESYCFTFFLKIFFFAGLGFGKNWIIFGFFPFSFLSIISSVYKVMDVKREN